MLSRARVYHFHDTSENAAVRKSCYIGDNRELHADAGNLAAMLRLYQRRESQIAYRRIMATVRTLIPGFDDFVLEPPDDSQEVRLDWKQVGFEHILGPQHLSDGSLRVIALATLLLQPGIDEPPANASNESPAAEEVASEPKWLPELILIDEPELGLHPHAVDVARRSSRGRILVIATREDMTMLDEVNLVLKNRNLTA